MTALGSTLCLASARYAWRYPGQLLLALAGVGLGVAVVTAVDLSIVSSHLAFERSHEAVAGRATHVLRAEPAGVDERLYADLRRRGLAARLAPIVAGYVSTAAAVPRTLLVLGVDLFSEMPFRPHLGATAARGWLSEFLSHPEGVVMSAGSAERLGLEVGERFAVRAGGRPRSLVLLGFVQGREGSGDATLSDLLIMDIAGAQELLNRVGRLSRVDVILEGDEEREALEAVLPPGVLLQSAGRRHQIAAQMARAFELNLRMLGLLSLMVGMFLIYNTMSFSVVRRRALIAQFRMLGVTRGGVFGLVMAEALALAGLASAAGMGLGVLLAQGLLDLVTRTLNDHYFVVAVSDVHPGLFALLKGFALGVGTGLLAAAVPALEATRVAPRTAALQSTVGARAHRLLPLASGLGALCLGGGAVLIAWPTRDPAAGFAALFALVLGCVLLAPGATRVCVDVVRRLTRRRGGILATIAVRGAAAGLARSAVAVAALMVALAATVGVGVMVDSFRRSVEVWLDRTLRADLYLGVPGRGGERTLPPSLADAIRALPAVEELSLGRVLPIDTERGPARLFVLRMARRSYAGFELLEGGSETAWSAFDARDAVLVSEPYAWRERLHGGDEIALGTPEGMRPFEVAGVYRDYETSEGTLLMSRATFLRHWADRGVSGIGVYVHPDRDPERVSEQIGALLPGDREIVLRPRHDIRQASLDLFDRTFTITGVLRLIACAVAFLGVLSALLALSLDRAREVAVLRAMGLTRREVFAVVEGETGLLGLIAGLLSIPVGLGMALLLIQVINRRSFGWSMSVHVDPRLCLEALALALLAALLAGLVPAWRMARQAPAAALRSE